ncbi:DUF2075 domain-containing protein [Streptomyces sp. 891-h]|uniref:DUF2075 domain-containing protein n=1 Tax=Streptomyces sp. 891-h TaxID=2720714 RepID=UPI001FAA8FDC|nr:DUF2075 domain-containing protein [Streptomyces sp. 891-h]
MLLLKLSAEDLLTLDERHRMVPHLAERWKRFRKSDASDGERAAWAESLVELARTMVDAGRGHVEMVVECAATIGQSPKSVPIIDVVLLGSHPETEGLSVQLVELKRWSSVTQVDSATATEVVVPGLGKKPHPALQLEANYQRFVGETGPLRKLSFESGGFTYLHNATEESVQPLLGINAPMGAYSAVYTRDRREQLMKDLRKHFGEDSGYSHAEILLRRMGVRNTPLLDAMIMSRGEDTVFTLRREQRTVADHVKDRAAKVLDENATDLERAVFVVTGGAGTGKSAIGLQLKAEFEAAGLEVRYASGSRAFNGAMQRHVGYGDREFQESFTYFSSFMDPPEEPLDVLICDEAHRLREISETRSGEKGTKPQVEEILDASRVAVFFLDEGQSVRPNEVGTQQFIVDAAEKYGAPVVPLDLRAQYRCGGSDAYVNWVHDLLGLSDKEPGRWVPDGLMHIEVADSPEEMERIIHAEARAGATARMVAGFCWPWNPPQGKEKRLVADVRIGDWHRPWNAKGDSYCENGAVPPGTLWSVHEGGIGQIGCVYTAQGLEWDWCGVIMGDDMVRRDGQWVFQRGKWRMDKETGYRRVAVPGSLDDEVRNSNLSDEEFRQCVRNAYHVLLTRASRATVLYSTDEETRAYLRELVGEVQIHGLRPSWQELPPALRVPHQKRPERRRSGKKKPQAPEGQEPLF